MTSLRGRCHTFDASADGYCRGEGSGAYYLQVDRSTVSVLVASSVIPEDSAV